MLWHRTHLIKNIEIKRRFSKCQYSVRCHPLELIANVSLQLKHPYEEGSQTVKTRTLNREIKHPKLNCQQFDCPYLHAQSILSVCLQLRQLFNNNYYAT